MPVVPFRWGVTVASVLFLAASAAAADPPAAAVPGDADFAADLYGRLATAGPGNVFLSPSGVRTALAMTATGAAGATARQMVAALRLPAGATPDTIAAAFAAARSPPAGGLDVADALWRQAGAPFRPAFTARLSASFGAEARTADFATAAEPARLAINAWAADHTGGHVRDLLPPRSLGPDTGLVLVDAVYFKGDWADPFEPGRTSDAPFRLDAAHAATVPMMRSAARRMPVFQSAAVSAVELPYQGGTASMVIVIPTAADGLATVERGLNGDAIRGWVAGLKPTEASLELPRFKAEAGESLNGPLVAMGMADAFDKGRADFSGMVDPAASRLRPYIGDVFHKAVVAVDEQGTEAAAATAVGMGMALTAQIRRPVRLVADHPFLYLVRDRQTGTIWFIGRCVDPRP